MKKILITILAQVLCALLLTACGRPAPLPGVYATENPTDPQQYNVYINKQVAAISNQLATAMMTANMVAKGAAEPAQALQSAEAGLEIIEEARDSISMMRPPLGYESAQESILDTISGIDNLFGRYIECLQAEDMRSDTIQDIADRMMLQHVLITQQANAYWQ